MSKKVSTHVSPATLSKKAKSGTITSTVVITTPIYQRIEEARIKKGFPYIQDVYRLAIVEFLERNNY